MALIVENGTGLADAESYISVADADEYLGKRGDTAWAALTTEQKEQALRRGTDYMVQVFRMRWRGSRVNAVQALDWPRAFVQRTDFEYSGLNGYTTIGGLYYYPNNVVPPEVAKACAEMATRGASADLLPDLGAQVTNETVGPISVSYAEGARQDTYYKAVQLLLAPFLEGRGQIPVVRS